MSPIVVVGALSSLTAAAALLVLLPPRLRMPWSALAVTGATSVATISSGWLLDVGTTQFLIGVSVFSLPVLVLLSAAAKASGADVFASRLALLVWALMVFPVTLILPLLMTRDCLAPDCGFTDFAAALPLAISSSAFVLVAWFSAKIAQPALVARPSTRRIAAATGLLLLAMIAWLVHLEGTVDAYTTRIALAALVVPVACAAGWLIADRLRIANRRVGRSLLFGMLVGMVVALSGVASIELPWLVVAGVLTGALAALTLGLVGRVTPSLATRWGAAVFVAAAVGFVAPAVSGAAAGLIFSARVEVLAAPLLVLVIVAAYSIAVSLPVWVLIRHRALRGIRAEQNLADT